MWFMTNSINKNSDANAMTVVSAITPIADGQAGIYDVIDGVNNNVNGLSDKLDTVIASNDKVIEETQKTTKKVESLSYLISKANAKKLADYQKCLMGQTGKMEDAIKACKDKLK
jgi:prophage DNA circulation protein